MVPAWKPLDPVLGVLLRIAEVQMVWVHALAVVACVQNPQTLWNLANVKQVRHPVGLDLPTFKSELAVTVTVKRRAPFVAPGLNRHYLVTKSL